MSTALVSLHPVEPDTLRTLGEALGYGVEVRWAVRDPGCGGVPGRARWFRTIIDHVDESLREAYLSGSLVAFVGDGLSRAAGLPSRRELVEAVLAIARDRGLYPSQLEDIEQLVAKGELVAALSELELALTPVAFTRAVTRTLDDGTRGVPPLAHALARLEKLRGVVTTNLDRLLERAFAGRWPSHARPLPGLLQRRGWILALHGTLGERDTWVLTRAEQARAASDEGHRHLLEALLLGTPLLFVACTFDDPQFANLLEHIAAISGEQPPSHFALFDPCDVDERRRRRLADMGIHAVLAPAPAGLLGCLHDLASA
jgi:hypothetical protein